MPEPANLTQLAIQEAQRARPLDSTDAFRRANIGRIIDRETMGLATLRCLAGDTFDFFEPLPGEQVYDPNTGEGRGRPGRTEVNNARYWLETLSNTYQTPPQRQFQVDGEPTEADDDPVIGAVTDYYEQAELDRVMEQVDFWLNAVANVVVRPMFDPDYKELVFHLYRGPQIRVVQNTLNPMRPWATVLTGVEKDDKGNAAHVRSEIFTPSVFIETVDGKQVQSTPLSEPVPLVHCFNAMPTNLTRYFAPSIGPSLCHIDRVLNNDLIGPLGYSVVMQGFAQAVIHGLEPGAKFTTGPGRVIQFSGDPDRRQDFQFVQPQAPLNDVVTTLETMLGMLRRAHGIPDGLLDVQTDASGAAIVQANAPLAEQREKRGKVFYRVETEMCRAVIRVLAGHDPRVPAGIDAMKYSVAASFKPPQTSLSVKDKNERQKFLLEIGVLTPGMIAVEEMPQLYDDPEEADEIIAERSVEKQEAANEQLKVETEIAAKNAPDKPQGMPFGK